MSASRWFLGSAVTVSAGVVLAILTFIPGSRLQGPPGELSDAMKFALALFGLAVVFYAAGIVAVIKGK